MTTLKTILGDTIAESNSLTLVELVEKQKQIYDMGFTYFVNVKEKNRRVYSNKRIFEYKNQIYLEEGADFFEVCLAYVDTHESQLLYKSFDIKQKLNYSDQVIFFFIKNITLDKVKYFWLKNQNPVFSYNPEIRANRKKQMATKIDKFLQDGELNPRDYLLGDHDRHDRSSDAEEYAKEFSRKFCKINSCGIHTYNPFYTFKQELDTLYLVAYDDGVSNHPCHTLAYLKISKKNRYNMSTNKLMRLFAEGYLCDSQNY